MKISTVIKQIEQTLPLEQYLDQLHQALKYGPSMPALKRSLPGNLGVAAISSLLDAWCPGYADLSAAERKHFAEKVWPIIQLEKGPTKKLHNPTHPLFKHFTTTNFMNFTAQRHNAKKRGIGFEFDFLSWLVWWLSTGKFDERGVYDHTYQMCRFNDQGPYKPDNVYCATGKQNRSDYHSKKDDFSAIIPQSSNV